MADGEVRVLRERKARERVRNPARRGGREPAGCAAKRARCRARRSSARGPTDERDQVVVAVARAIERMLRSTRIRMISTASDTNEYSATSAATPA